MKLSVRENSVFQEIKTWTKSAARFEDKDRKKWFPASLNNWQKITAQQTLNVFSAYFGCELLLMASSHVAQTQIPAKSSAAKSNDLHI